MFKILLQDTKLFFLFLLTVLIRLFSLNETWVEQYYSLGFYPLISGMMRFTLGWIPFSVGDLLYIAAFLWLIIKTWKLIKLLKTRQTKEHLSWMLFRKYLKLGLLVYIFFSLFWGLNYYRQGIDKQLGLNLQPYSVEDLFTLTTVLQQRLNQYAEKVDSVQRLSYNESSHLFKKGEEAYQQAQLQYYFLDYANASIKPSIFTPVGHLVGFTGYFNPFSSEAQLKTTIPVFVKPFVVAHEIAHQLGYAKENEASFVAYLAGKASTDINYIYSVYFEMYRDAIFECRLTPNKELTETVSKNIHPRVRWDVYDLRLYLIRNKNMVEPLMSEVYDRYLKLNNQPKGKATYNEVIGYLIAYMKKFGKESI